VGKHTKNSWKKLANFLNTKNIQKKLFYNQANNTGCSVSRCNLILAVKFEIESQLISVLFLLTFQTLNSELFS